MSLSDPDAGADAEGFFDGLAVETDVRLDGVVAESVSVPVEDGPAAEECAELPWVLVDGLAPLSACATPAPLARAAPMPRLIAPAPSHWYGSMRCGFSVW